MGLFAFAFSFFVDILWAATISYGAALVASQFIKKPKQRVPNLGGYPIQTSQKAVAIPVVKGCCRAAGNVIWMGPQGRYEKKTHQPDIKGHVRVLTYFKSFMIGIAEGEGSITKIWNGKTLLWSSAEGVLSINNDTQTITVGPASTVAESGLTDGTIRISKGDGTQDARFYTGEDFGKYDDLIWAHFVDFETGVTENIPNFSFEVCTGSAYQYSYLSETDGIYAIPLFGEDVSGLDAGGVAVDIGGGMVSLPMERHPYRVGEVVNISGTGNYNGLRTLLAGTTWNELHITAAYVPEAFDGEETVIKLIGSLTAGNARMAVDVRGNIWFGHNVNNQKSVIRIAPDGTQTTDDLNGVFTQNCFDLFPSADAEYITLMLAGGVVSKYSVATGDREWTNVGVVSCQQAAIDSDGTVYMGSNSAAADAWKVTTDNVNSNIVGFGTPIVAVGPGVGGNATIYTMAVDDSMNILCGGGTMFTPVGDGEGTPYNLCAKSLDSAAIARLAVGGVYLDQGNTVYQTYSIQTGNIQFYGGFIYVLSGTPNETLYKIAWDATVPSLTVVESEVLGTAALGFFVDTGAGNLVVIPAGADPDRLWFYDLDLNFLSKKSDLPALLGTSWGGGAGVIHGSALRFPAPAGPAENDENPSAMISDLTQQTRYGAGIDPIYINNASFDAEWAYWESQEYRLSIALTEQLPLMDWVDFILGHCNGYRHWSEGQLHLGAFKDKPSIVSLDQDDLVREDGENPPPPVQIVKRKATETSNLIELSWIDREKTYDLSVAVAKDDVDRRVSGKVRINPVDLTGIKRKELAIRQAYQLLFEGMYRFSIYSFDVAYKNMLYEVGDMIDLSDGGQLVSERMLIIAREEDKDGRLIKIEAVEDIAGLYPAIPYDTEQTLAVPDVPTGSGDLVSGTLSFREHVTAPNLYLFFSPGDSITNGAFIYRSFDDELYEFVGRVAFDRDTLPNSAGTTTSILSRAKSVLHRYSESFTVDIGTITSLRLDVSDDEFFQNQSLVKIGNEIMAFKTAEDQGSGVWKLTQTIRGLFGTEAIEHPVGSVFATVSLIDLFYYLVDEVAGQTVYFKALATAPFDVSQTLDIVAATEYTVIREHQRPYPISIQGVKDAGGLCTVDSFPVTMEFNLASKEAGYNLGGHGEVGWGNFTKDERIVGINVTLKTTGGVEISFSFFDLAGYHASDYELDITEADRDGNDPILVELEPVAALPSSKTTVNTIDLVT